MNDQWISMIVGAGVVVALRLLDWAFPKGVVWRKVRDWSIPTDEVTRGKQDDPDDQRD